MKKLILLIVLLAITACSTDSTNTPINTKHNIVFIWEGSDSDIPQDGTYIQISATVGDTVYINPIDE